MLALKDFLVFPFCPFELNSNFRSKRQQDND